LISIGLWIVDNNLKGKRKNGNMQNNTHPFKKNISKFEFLKSPEKIFLLIALFFGISFLVLTPLFEVADEPAHFFKAYALSDLQYNGGSAYLPKSITDIYAPLTKNNSIPFHPNKKFDIQILFSVWDYPLNASNKQWTPGIPAYAFVPYIPQIIGIEIGKCCNASPVMLMYFGRFFNLLIWVCLIFSAIRITPVGKWLFLVLSLLPMSLFQAASLSPDAAITGMSFLLIALILYYALNSDKKSITNWDMVLLLILSMALAVSKQVYFLIPLIFLIIPVARFSNKKDFIVKFCLLILSIIVVMALLSMSINQSIPIPSSTQNINGSQPSQISEEKSSAVTQVSFIFNNPVKYCFILKNTLFTLKDLYIDSFIGIFGWLDTPLPGYIYYLFIGLIFFVALCDTEQNICVTTKQKGLFLLISLLTIGMIFTAIFVFYHPHGINLPGSTLILGVQGRYFITLAPLIFLILNNNKKILSERQMNYAKMVVLVLLVYALFISIRTLEQRYYPEPMPLSILYGISSGIIIIQICFFGIIEIIEKRRENKTVVRSHSGSEINNSIIKLVAVFVIVIIFSIIFIFLIGT
jgi:uncharacterized membrane protein